MTWTVRGDRETLPSAAGKVISGGTFWCDNRLLQTVAAGIFRYCSAACKTLSGDHLVGGRTEAEGKSMGAEPWGNIRKNGTAVY